jgi:hypothetical protein
MTTKAPLRFPTSASSQGRKPDTSRDLTSERIAQHMNAFQDAGGTIEVLGTTPVLKHVGKPTVTAETP